MSDLLLQMIAIRLAGLVLAGVVIQALPDRHSAPSCVPVVATGHHAAAPAPVPRIDLALRDMRLHD